MTSSKEKTPSWRERHALNGPQNLPPKHCSRAFSPRTAHLRASAPSWIWALGGARRRGWPLRFSAARWSKFHVYRTRWMVLRLCPFFSCCCVNLGGFGLFEVEGRDWALRTKFFAVAFVGYPPSTEYTVRGSIQGSRCWYCYRSRFVLG